MKPFSFSTIADDWSSRRLFPDEIQAETKAAQIESERLKAEFDKKYPPELWKTYVFQSFFERSLIFKKFLTDEDAILYCKRKCYYSVRPENGKDAIWKRP